MRFILKAHFTIANAKHKLQKSPVHFISNSSVPSPGSSCPLSVLRIATSSFTLLKLPKMDHRPSSFEITNASGTSDNHSNSSMELLITGAGAIAIDEDMAMGTGTPGACASGMDCIDIDVAAAANSLGVDLSLSGADLDKDLRVLAESHLQIRRQLEEARAELAAKKAELKYETERTRQLGANVCIQEQNLRTLNEKLYKAKEECSGYEVKFDKMIHEKTYSQYQLEQTQDEIDKKLNLLRSMRKKQEEYKEKVLKETITSLEEVDPAYTKLKEEVRALLEIKQKLQTGDPEVIAIRTGTALQIVEAQKQAVLNGITERQLESDLVVAELEERKEALRKAEQAVFIAEKQNQARIRKKQRFLEDQKATIEHIKMTALHLEKKLK